MSIRKIINNIKKMDDTYIRGARAKLGRFASLIKSRNTNFQEALRVFDKVPINPSGNYFDIGANVGNFAQLILERFQPDKLVCVEPLPNPFKKLSERYKRHKNVFTHHCALGANQGETNIEVNTHEEASSILPIKRMGLVFDTRDLTPLKHIKVPLKTLDSICIQNEINNVELLKMDVQGYELEVLKGANNALNFTRIILSEVNFYDQYQGNALFWDIHKYLQERDFYLFNIKDFQTNENGFALQGDAIYINKNLL